MGALPVTSTLQDSGVTRAIQNPGSIASPYGTTSYYDTGSNRLVNTVANFTNPNAKPQAQMGQIYQLSQPQRNQWFNAQRY